MYPHEILGSDNIWYWPRYSSVPPHKSTVEVCESQGALDVPDRCRVGQSRTAFTSLSCVATPFWETLYPRNSTFSTPNSHLTLFAYNLCLRSTSNSFRRWVKCSCIVLLWTSTSSRNSTRHSPLSSRISEHRRRVNEAGGFVKPQRGKHQKSQGGA